MTVPPSRVTAIQPTGSTGWTRKPGSQVRHPDRRASRARTHALGIACGSRRRAGHRRPSPSVSSSLRSSVGVTPAGAPASPRAPASSCSRTTRCPRSDRPASRAAALLDDVGAQQLARAPPRPPAGSRGSTPRSSSTRRPPSARRRARCRAACSSARRRSSVSSRPRAVASIELARALARSAAARRVPSAASSCRLGRAAPPRRPHVGGLRAPPAHVAARGARSASSRERRASAVGRAGARLGGPSLDVHGRRRRASPPRPPGRPRPAAAPPAPRHAPGSRRAAYPSSRQRLRQRPIRLGQRRLERQVPVRHAARPGRVAAAASSASGRSSLCAEPRAVAGRRPPARAAARASRRPSAVRTARAASWTARRSRSWLRARGHRARDLAHVRFGRARAPSSAVPVSVRSAVQAVSASATRGRPHRASGAWAATSSAAASSSPAVTPRRLLLGELPQPPGLRPQLGEDVLDPGQVRLGLGQLLLGPPPPPLVTADPGDLLEQRPALLGPQRERLVDHALADEQERVLGEVRASRAGPRGPAAGPAAG